MFMMRISGLYKSFFVVETHVYNSKDPAEKYENLNFLLLSVCFHFFENYPTQFLSHSESAELVFCSEDLSFLPFKNPNKIFNSERKESIFTIFCLMFWIIKIIFATETPLIVYFFFSADDNAPWKFTVRGCFKTNPNKPVDKIKIKNSDKTPASLLEITLRVVYTSCFGPQVTRTNVNEFKRGPRLTSSFGKWLLFKVSK